MRVFTPVSAIIWKKEGGPPLPPRSVVNVLAATAMGGNIVDDPTKQETEFTLAKVPTPGNLPKVLATTISTTPPMRGSLGITIPTGRTYRITLLAFFTVEFYDSVSITYMRQASVGHWQFTEGAGTVTFEDTVTLDDPVFGVFDVKHTLRRNNVNTGQTRGLRIATNEITAVAGHFLALIEDIT
jgi:hypothetical protein